MDNITIRRMTEDDIDKVYSIETQSFTIPWSKQAFENDLKNNACARYLAATYEGNIIGYAGIWIILDEGHITNIAIAPPFRGKGIGSELFRALLQYASNLGVGYVTLEVRVSNTVAQKMYKKLNFLRVNTRKNYYEDNHEDAYLMVCDKLPCADENFSEENYFQTYSVKL